MPTGGVSSLISLDARASIKPVTAGCAGLPRKLGALVEYSQQIQSTFEVFSVGTSQEALPSYNLYYTSTESL
jgi:hypothetical protein